MWSFIYLLCIFRVLTCFAFSFVVVAVLDAATLLLDLDVCMFRVLPGIGQAFGWESAFARVGDRDGK